MSDAPVSDYVDEAGDGVLFGPIGRDRLTEARFMNALWTKVSLIHDVDDRSGADYGRYLREKNHRRTRRK